MKLLDGSANLQINGRKVQFPVVKASRGPDGIFISELRNDKYVMLDPGFFTTAQCESKITFIDGENSVLAYRGYPIEQLAKHSTFLEVAYLLLCGKLPKQDEFDNFKNEINHLTLVGEDFRSYLGTFSPNLQAMSTLSSSICALENFSPGTADIADPKQVDLATKIIMAKARTITSFIHRRKLNEPLLYSDCSRGYIDDFLRMCFAVPYERFDSDPLFVETLDKLLILHADHEQNCSTSVVRIVGSANASLYSSVAAGVNALSGPLHGGANEAALLQLERIRQYVIQEHKTVKDFIDDVKKSGQKLSGLGHRVYKSYDPRAAISKSYAKRIFDSGTGSLDLFDIALELEDIAMNDDYFKERRLYPNIDFWTGLIYHAIGFESTMFTTLFALGRIPGWIAHWREMHENPMSKIGRPRQIYTGETEKKYTPIEER
ncbi:MAG: citrate synthase [Candidatus Ancillula trichonymphae]|jgi:citrate synthase|nr:citrate synthase [Candidatus Ancillula trichonymphae]